MAENHLAITGMSIENITVSNVLDVTAALVVVAGMAIGYIRGLSGELASLVCTACSLGVSLAFLGLTGPWLADHTRVSQKASLSIAFFGVFIAVYLLILIPRFLLGKMMKVVFEKGPDKIGGILAGGVRTATIVAVIYALMAMVPNDYLNEAFGTGSRIGRVVARVMPDIEEKLDDVSLQDKLEDAADADAAGRLLKRK